MILEGILTTLNADGSLNVSPMGPRVDEELSEILLRPFQTSTTYRNLKRTRQGVFHVTDDVELLAQAALGTPDPLPSSEPATAKTGSSAAAATTRAPPPRSAALGDNHRIGERSRKKSRRRSLPQRSR